MTVNHLWSPSRGDSVMTGTAIRTARRLLMRGRGYDFISPTVARHHGFRLAVPFGFAHGVHGLLRRDAAVMTRVVSLSILEVA